MALTTIPTLVPLTSSSVLLVRQTQAFAAALRGNLRGKMDKTGILQAAKARFVSADDQAFHYGLPAAFILYTL